MISPDNVGNICRSPIAEAVFIDLIKKENLEENWEIDSAALGPWHVGNDPDYRAIQTIENHKLAYDNQARQVWMFSHVLIQLI